MEMLGGIPLCSTDERYSGTVASLPRPAAITERVVTAGGTIPTVLTLLLARLELWWDSRQKSMAGGKRPGTQHR
jgi:hypothetical protein